MFAFLTRRFVASLAVLLVASFIVYVLTCYSGNPLQDLQASKAPNREQLIQQRIEFLHLDVPPVLRYFIWLGGLLQGFVGHFSLGQTSRLQPVTSQLASAMGVTIQLLIAATIIAIIVGIAIGIATALRQYTVFDYTTTFFAFLFFSLPSFWLAVVLKQYLAIGFNNFLDDPVFGPVITVVVSVIVGVVWLGIIGGNARRRLIVFLVAGAATAALMAYFSLTHWFENPSLGVVGIGLLSVGTAVLVTALSAGLENRRALWASLTAAVVGIALYYPLQYLWAYYWEASFLQLLVLAVVAVGVGALIGWLWGGFDRRVSMRVAGLTSFIVGFLIVIDRFMQTWLPYTDAIGGRPIATIGSVTPNFHADFWGTGIDTFTHLLLPTVSLTLISLAGYSRYTRASMLEVMNQDYIRTARSKGLNERTVVMRHAFRNALIPVVTIVTLDFGALFSGAIITEHVFNFQGLGRMFEEALNLVDVNSIMGVFLVSGIAAIVFNVVADVIYSALDPRIRVAA